MPDDTPECWLPVPGYEGFYEVSDWGRVRSLPRHSTRGRILKQHMIGDVRKYPAVHLSKNNIPATKVVHRLVLRAFVGPPPPGKPECCHADDDPMNNRLSNLRWDTRKANAADAVRNGKTNASLTHCKRGHEFTPENTWTDKLGHRWCRACARFRKNPDGKLAASDRTHCPQGHPYDEANTCYSSGRRHCRTCGRERMRARRAAKKVAA